MENNNMHEEFRKMIAEDYLASLNFFVLRKIIYAMIKKVYGKKAQSFLDEALSEWSTLMQDRLIGQSSDLENHPEFSQLLQQSGFDESATLEAHLAAIEKVTKKFREEYHGNDNSK